jgi:poly(3-hydroxybutyrate) depolymerase
MRRPAIILLAVLAAPAVFAQDWAKTRLEKSTRRHEQVSVASAGRAIRTFIVYPDSKDKKPVVLLLHDQAGLTDWFKNFADEVAGLGYLAVAPDLKAGRKRRQPSRRRPRRGRRLRQEAARRERNPVCRGNRMGRRGKFSSGSRAPGCGGGSDFLWRIA